MANNNEKKFIDSEKFRVFMAAVPSGELSNFIDSIVDSCGIRRATYHNWRSGLCHIPEDKKLIIESLAGCKIWNGEHYETIKATKELCIAELKQKAGITD